MKKLILSLSVISLLASCSSNSGEGTTSTDSLAVDTVVVKTDSTSVDTVVVKDTVGTVGVTGVSGK